MDTVQTQAHQVQTTPEVSVVITVKDGAPYLEKALRAVMRQTLEDIEIIVIDDASVDETPAILSRLTEEDPRLVVKTNDTNMGIAGSTNIGLDIARGRYIARTDADDLTDPVWLETLHSFLEEHPELDFAGSSTRHITPEGTFIKNRHLGRSAAEMRWYMRFTLAIAHPTVMFRRHDTGPLADMRYDTSIRAASDYDFFARRMAYCEGANIDVPLVSYRVHRASISNTRWREQIATAKAVATKMQREEFSSGTFEALAAFRAAFYDFEPVPAAQILSGLRAAARHDRGRLRAGWVANEILSLYVMAMRRPKRGWPETLLNFAFRAPDLLMQAVAFRAVKFIGSLTSKGS